MYDVKKFFHDDMDSIKRTHEIWTYSHEVLEKNSTKDYVVHQFNGVLRVYMMSREVKKHKQTYTFFVSDSGSLQHSFQTRDTTELVEKSMICTLTVTPNETTIRSDVMIISADIFLYLTSAILFDCNDPLSRGWVVERILHANDTLIQCKNSQAIYLEGTGVILLRESNDDTRSMLSLLAVDTSAVVGNYVNYSTSMKAISISFISSDTGYLVSHDSTYTYYTLYKSDNHGVTWKEVHGFGTAENLTVRFLDEMNGWILLENGNVRFTTTGGVTWTPSQLPVDEPTAAVHFSGIYEGWIVTESGKLFRTNDFGRTWSLISFSNLVQY